MLKLNVVISHFLGALAFKPEKNRARDVPPKVQPGGRVGQNVSSSSARRPRGVNDPQGAAAELRRQADLTAPTRAIRQKRVTTKRDGGPMPSSFHGGPKLGAHPFFSQPDSDSQRKKSNFCVPAQDSRTKRAKTSCRCFGLEKPRGAWGFE